MTMNTIVEIRDLHFGYGRFKLFQGMELSLKGGQIYGLLGKNGAGKTTLLKLIAGLLNPKQGEIETLGYEAFRRDFRMLEDICFIPEEWAVPDLNIQDMPYTHGVFYPRFDEAYFWRLVDELEIPTNGKLTGSSFGQKKKAIIAFGLATRARLIVLDEPTNGLDIPSKSKFRKIISAGIDEDTCMVISTHQVRDMVNLIDPIIILDQGKVIFQEDIVTIGSKLKFQVYSSLAEPQHVLHAERIPGGYMTVMPNEGGDDSEMDIEVLFNAVLHQRDTIDNIFKN